MGLNSNVPLRLMGWNAQKYLRTKEVCHKIFFTYICLLGQEPPPPTKKKVYCHIELMYMFSKYFQKCHFIYAIDNAL